MSIHSLNVSLPRLPASHKRCKVAWFGDAGGSETIETIPNIILQVHSATVTWNCWIYFGNLKRVTNTRDYQPTIHSGTQMWTCGWTCWRKRFLNSGSRYRR